MLILKYTHLPIENKKQKIKMIIKNTDVLIYWPIQLIACFPT
jgi:hypothetical protein